MSENAITITPESMPMKLQLARLVISIVAGFAATKLTEKGFDYSVIKWRNRGTTPQ